MTIQTTTTSSNGVATHEKPRATMPNLPTVIGGDASGLHILQDWVTAAGNAETLARGLVSSFFVPEAYKPRGGENSYETAVANATGAILLGQSLGLDPLTSLQQIYVVHGRPGMYTKIKVALAQAAGHEIWDEVYSPDRVTVCGRRKGTENVVRIEITMEMAKTAGWTTNKKYTETPADMLWSRAAARVCDRVAADVLHGIASIEDLHDIDPDTQQQHSTPPRVRITAAEIVGQAATTATETPAPAPPSTSPESPTTEGITQNQLRRLHATFGTLGVTDRAERLAIVSAITCRSIGSSNDVTKAEAAILIDTLTSLSRETDPAAAIDRVLGRQRPADGEIQAEDPPADALIDEPEGWR